MKRTSPAVLALVLVIGLVMASTAVQSDAARTENPSMVLKILELEPAQWKEMSKQERRSFLKALPTETRQELRSALDSKRGVLTPEQRRQGTPVQIDAPARQPLVNGLIQYDSGNPAGFFATGGLKGNRFNTALSPAITVCPGGPGSCPPVLNPGTITKVAAFVLPAPPPVLPPTWTSLVYFGIWGPQSGSSVPLLLRVSGANFASTTVSVTLEPPLAYAGPSFQVVVQDAPGWSSSWTTSTTGGGTTTYAYAYNALVAAYDPGTTGQQGHHAISILGWGGIDDASPIADIPSMNMMVRASGNVLVPVELMNFSIE